MSSTGSGWNLISSLGTLIAKAVANPLGAVVLSLMGSLIVGIVMSVRQPPIIIQQAPPQKSLSTDLQTTIAPDAGRKNAERDEEIRRLLKKLRRQKKRLQRKNDELQRKNERLRSENESLKAEIADNNRRIRELEKDVAELKRRRLSRSTTTQQPLPTRLQSEDPLSLRGAMQASEMGRRPQSRLPLSSSERRLRSIPIARKYLASRDNSPSAVAMRNAARARQDAEDRERAARRRAAVEVGRRESRRSAFNRVFDQR